MFVSMLVLFLLSLAVSASAEDRLVPCGEYKLKAANLYCHPYVYLGLDTTLDECAQAAAEHDECFQNGTTKVISHSGNAYNGTCRCARTDCSFYYDSHPHTTYEIDLCPPPTRAPTSPTAEPTETPTFSSPTTSPSTPLPSTTPTASPSTSPTVSTPTKSPSTPLPSTTPTQSPSRSPHVRPSYLPTIRPTFLPTWSPSIDLDRKIKEPFYRDLVHTYCPLQEDTARVCYDALTPPIIVTCNSAFSTPCEHDTTLTKTKFVEAGLCITLGMSAEFCAELGFGFGYTFTGSACVGVDYGQEECATHGRDSQRSETLGYAIDPGNKICIYNIGVGCSEDVGFQGYMHVETVAIRDPCPTLKELQSIPECYVHIEDEQEDEECHMIPESSDCFILENENTRSAKLLCGGTCKDSFLEETINNILTAVEKQVNKIVPMSELSRFLPWRKNSGDDDGFVTFPEVDLDGCDFRAEINLFYNYHPLEGWIDTSGYNIQTDTYHPGHAVTYCVGQTVVPPDDGTTALSLLLAFVVTFLLHV